MASVLDVLGPVFFTEMVIILGLMVLNTYFLTRRPLMLRLREIYFVNSPSFRRAWYMVIAAMVFFLASRAVVESQALGALSANSEVTEKVFLILFASLILGSFIELVLVFNRYLPHIGAGDQEIERRIRAHIRENVIDQDADEGFLIDLSLGGDLLRGRPTLGPYVSIAHYRGVVLGMTQYLEKRFGQLGDAILYSIGRQSGLTLAADMLKDIQDPKEVLDGFLQEVRMANVGLASVVQHVPERTNIRVEECAACAGMEPQGHSHCHYLTGLFTGMVEALDNNGAITTREVKCWVKGDTFCEFQIDHGPEAFPSAPNKEDATSGRREDPDSDVQRDGPQLGMVDVGDAGGRDGATSGR